MPKRPFVPPAPLRAALHATLLTALLVALRTARTGRVGAVWRITDNTRVLWELQLCYSSMELPKSRRCGPDGARTARIAWWGRPGRGRRPAYGLRFGTVCPYVERVA